MSSSNAGTSKATKEIKITDSKPQGSIYQNQSVIKLFRIALTLFYGQFFGNALYVNLIGGIPYIIENESIFGIIRVTIGVIIIAVVVFAMIGIWKKLWFIVFPSAILLTLVSIASLVVSIVDIVQRRERKDINGKEIDSKIAETVVEFVFRVVAIVLQFLFVKFLRAGYKPVPTSA